MGEAIESLSESRKWAGCFVVAIPSGSLVFSSDPPNVIQKLTSASQTEYLGYSGWSWEGGPWSFHDVEWLYLLLAWGSFAVAALSLAAWWKRWPSTARWIVVAGCLSYLHGILMVLIDDGDGDFLGFGTVLTVLALGSMALAAAAWRHARMFPRSVVFLALGAALTVCMFLPRFFPGDRGTFQLGLLPLGATILIGWLARRPFAAMPERNRRVLLALAALHPLLTVGGGIGMAAQGSPPIPFGLLGGLLVGVEGLVMLLAPLILLFVLCRLENRPVAAEAPAPAP